MPNRCTLYKSFVRYVRISRDDITYMILLSKGKWVLTKNNFNATISRQAFLQRTTQPVKPLIQWAGQPTDREDQGHRVYR